MNHDLSRLLKSCRDIMRKDRGLSGDLDRLPQLSWMLLLKLLDGGPDPLIPSPYRWQDWAARPGVFTGDGLLSFVDGDETELPDGTRGPGLFCYLGSLGGDRRVDAIAAVFRGARNRMTSGHLMRQVLDRLDQLDPDPDGLQTASQLYEGMLAQLGSAAGDSGEFYTPRPVVRLMVAVTDPQPGETVLDPACGTGGFLVEAHRHLAARGHTGLQLHGVEAKALPHLLAQVNLLLSGVQDPCIEHGNALCSAQDVPRSALRAPSSVDLVLSNPPFGGQEEERIQAGFSRELRTRDTTLLFLQRIMDRLREPSGRAAVVVPESVMDGGGVGRKVRRMLVNELGLHTVVRLPRGVFEPYTDIQTNLLFFGRAASSPGVWFYQHEVPRQRRRLQNPCYTRTQPLRFQELEPIIAWWSRRQETEQAWLVTGEQIRRRGYSLDFRHPDSRAPRGRAEAPALTEQLESTAERCRSLAAAMRATLASVTTVDPGRWPLLPLSALLTPVKQRASIDPGRSYNRITVRLHGRGVIQRGAAVEGSELAASRLFVARAGQLIMSRIDARNGAFGIVPPELDGAVVSGDFPLFRPEPGEVDADYLSLVLCSKSFVELCARCSRGTTNRKRISVRLLLEQRLRVPLLDVQRQAVEAARRLRSLQREATELGQQAVDLLALLADVHVALEVDD